MPYLIMFFRSLFSRPGVLAGIFQNFTLCFLLGGLVVGIIACLAFHVKRFRLAVIVCLVIYFVCEILATIVYDGHMASLGPMIVGAFALGWGLAYLLFWIGVALFGSRKKKA